MLEFIKLPQKLENKWLLKATQALTEQYDIQFALGKNFFVQIITATTFNYINNQRLCGGMEKLGPVWYDRVPSDKDRTTLFGESETRSEKKEVWFGRLVIKGYLVTRIRMRKKTPSLYPAKLAHAIKDCTDEADFIEKTRELWHNCKVRTLIQRVPYTVFHPW